MTARCVLVLVVFAGCGGDDDDGPSHDDAGVDGASDDAGADGGVDGPTTEPQFPDAQEEALELLAGASAVAPEARFDGVRPRFATFEVPVPGPATADPVAQAFQFLAAYPELYRIADPAQELHLARISSDDEAQHVVLGQHLEGHPVFGAELAVHLSDGNVIATNGAWIPDFVPRGASPVLTPAGAELVALGLAQGGYVAGRARLVWWDGSLLAGGPPETPVLAYLVSVAGGDTFYTVVLDATDGHALRLQDEMRSHDPRKNFEIKTANNSTSGTCWNLAWEPGDNWLDENGAIAGQTPSADGLAAFDDAHATYDAFYDSFHRHMWDGGDGTLDAWVHVGVNWGNASWVPGCRHLRFADGWVLPDIFGHEFTHALISNTSDLEYADQPGALNESFADVLAELHDPEDDWIHGFFGPGVFVRSLADPPLVGQPDHMLAETSGNGLGLMVRTGPVDCDVSSPTYNDCGFVHGNSGIPNKAWYLITQGGTHNGYTMLGIRDDRARQLAYQVVTGWLTRNAQLADARDAAVALARRWVEARTATADNLCAVQNAWASVGLGAGDRDCDGALDPDDPDQDGDRLPDATDNCPAVRNGDQEDMDGDRIGDRCDRDADGDGLANGTDNCPRVSNGGQEDADGDAIGDVCEDEDGDGVLDPVDNCPVANPRQEDLDADTRGDACDSDIDGDGTANEADHCPRLRERFQVDWDFDGLGDACDNCPDQDNADQANLDGDRQGDVCDWDDDGDQVADGIDVCPTDYDPGQMDLDGNGVGTACDEEEAALRDGSGEPVSGAANLGDLFAIAQIGIAPCLADGCPDWIGADVWTTVTLTSTRDIVSLVTDDLGRVVSSRTVTSNQQGYQTTLRFAPSPQTHFVAPGGTAPPFEGRSYFLVLAPGGAQGFEDVPLTIEITSEGL